MCVCGRQALVTWRALLASRVNAQRHVSHESNDCARAGVPYQQMGSKADPWRSSSPGWNRYALDDLKWEDVASSSSAEPCGCTAETSRPVVKIPTSTYCVAADGACG
eukprot:Skav212762  [mRNA]  locus=scaffold2545:377319:383665:- [translate_table: standard]